MNYVIENCYDSEDLPGLNLALEQSFGHAFLAKFGRISSRKVLEPRRDTMGIVLAGRGTVQSVGGVSTSYAAEENDLLFLHRGASHTITPDDYLDVFMIDGRNILPQGKHVSREKEAERIPGIAGGTRKTLKQWDGKANLDVHLIWVDESNVKIPHYHKNFSELYLVQAGAGAIHLQHAENYETHGLHYDFESSVKQGDALVVPPRVIHNTTGSLTAHVIGIPHFVPGDIHFVRSLA